MSNSVKITDTEILSDEKFPLKSIEYQLTEKKKTRDKKAEVYFRPDAVAVLLYNEEQNTFLLTQQFRLPAYLNGVITGHVTEVCAGLIDDGESPEQTARREAKEELGYAIKKVKKIGAAFTSVGAITEKVHLFIAPYTDEMKTGEGGGLEAEGESVKLIEISMDEARKKLDDHQFNDMKTILLLQHYFLNNSK